MKNLASQLVSPLRTVMIGKYHADPTGSRRFNLPPGAYVREDRQSDHLVALLFNPYFVVESPDAGQNYCVHLCAYMCMLTIGTLHHFVFEHNRFKISLILQD